MRPYFKNQMPSCRYGCFYPDCTRVGDDGFGRRLLFCKRHGFQIVRSPKGSEFTFVGFLTSAQRKTEIKRIRGKKEGK